MSLPPFAPLVDANTLAAHPEWRIVDCRHDLRQPQAGRQAYAEAHIPDAFFLHLDDDLSGARRGDNGRHPLPDAEALARRLAACGIDAQTTVVAYDEQNGMFAARLWWLLRWLGHARVAVLDGGLAAWTRAGLPLSRELPSPDEGARLIAAPRADMVVDAADVLASVQASVGGAAPGDSARLIVDARSADRFRGENETLDPVGGHIPGAVNRCFAENLAADGVFKPAAQLRAEFAALLDGRAPAQVISQCGSGVTACHNLLAMEVAGLPGARLYPGSWSEWCADPSRPVARGDA